MLAAGWRPARRSAKPFYHLVYDDSIFVSLLIFTPIRGRLGLPLLHVGCRWRLNFDQTCVQLHNTPNGWFNGQLAIELGFAEA
jgi:hypothetical protein